MADWSDPKMARIAQYFLLNAQCEKHNTVFELKDRSVTIGRFWSVRCIPQDVSYLVLITAQRHSRIIRGELIQSIRYAGDPGDVTASLLAYVQRSSLGIGNPCLPLPYTELVSAARCLRILTPDLEKILRYLEKY